MRLAYTCLIFSILAITVGCQGNDPYSRYKLGPARDVIAGSVQTSGGLDAWRSINKIHAIAIVSNYDDAGLAHISRMSVVISPWSDSISAQGTSPQGQWQASLSDNGRINMTGQASQDSGAMRDILATILHNSKGAINLLGGEEKVLSASKARISGEELSRIAVAGNKGMVRAYYFSNSEKILRYITVGADAPGQDGTLTTLSHGNQAFVTLRPGMTMPKSFTVVRIGQHVLPSDKKVMAVEFSDVRAD
jgi:hypothetical protein